ncbi:MAG: methylthioribulose 1-phosphate dehydratase [Pirellulaceae bacterium]
MHTHEQPLPDYLQPHAEAIAGLQRVGRIFWERRWSLGTSSNYSVVVNREPLQLLVTASGKDKGRLECGDFVIVDAEGNPVHEGQPKSSAETLLHCVAAKAGSATSNVGAVLHTHSVWSTVLSERFWPQGGILIEGFEMLKGLSGVTTHQHAEWLPIFENTQHIPDLAEKVTAAMTDTKRPLTHGYLIRRHGIYTWGSDLEEAFRQIEIIEFLLECLGRQASM